MINKTIATDFNIYEGILFHIMQNALKFSNPSSKIEINTSCKMFSTAVDGLDGYLVTKVTNLGPSLN